ncbi:MAG: penicillin-binding protein activator [Porticoccaceae bacterium]
MKNTFALRLIIVAFSALTLLGLQSCGSTQTAPNSSSNTTPSGPSEDALRYEHLANLSVDETEQAVYQYLAALSWYEEGFRDRAYFLFNSLNQELLDQDQRLTRQLTLSDYYRERGQPAIALELLEEPWIQNELGTANNLIKSRWAGATAQLSLLLGNYERAFRVYDFALSSSSESEQEQFRNGLWRSLTLVNSLPAPPYASQETEGWVDLARINNQSAGRVTDQYLEYLLWQDSYYNHPAQLNPPPSFTLLEQIATSDRPRAAILLPLSGELSAAGNAILDGYMAARANSYQTRSLEPEDPLAPFDIEIFDTNANNITNIVRQLRDGEFDLVIGPLDRALVATYVEIMPDIPTLVLNSLPEELNLSEKPVLGLSLNVEQEAEQAAVRALQEGHQSAIALVPDSEWGYRAGEAFTDFWIAEGGNLVSFARYGDSTSHADLLESNLHVDASIARKNALQGNLGRALEFTPRRRQDVDALFLAASPQQARQLKPMLAFFFAEDIPVYATSSIYSGFPDPSADRDLDGVKFSTMPWILNNDNELRNNLSNQTNASATALRMQALGIDSFYLSQRLIQLYEAPDTIYRGILGKLSKDSQSNDLEREQVWAQFIGGLARPVNN